MNDAVRTHHITPHAAEEELCGFGAARVEVGNGIRRDNDVESALSRNDGRGQHALVRCDASQHDGLDLHISQMEVNWAGVECAAGVFVQERLAGPRSNS